MKHITAAAQKIPPFILSSEKLYRLHHSWLADHFRTVLQHAGWAIGKWTQEDSFTMD
jgi:hypothetical protein